MLIEEKIEYIYNMLEKMRVENNFVCKNKQCYFCPFGSWQSTNTLTKKSTFICEYEQREVIVTLNDKKEVIEEETK